MGDSHAGHYGALMTKIVEKKNFNFIMHPQGGLKLLNKNNEEHILAPLREYENRFKKDDIIIFSASIGNYKDDAEFTKTYKVLFKKLKNLG